MGSSEGSCSHYAYPQLILFGDSITQAAEYELFPPLRDSYIRRVDVVNRGFSGYTSAMALDVLPKFMPSPDQAHVRLMTIFFGANDACLPGNAQYVPLEKYVNSLEAIITHQCVKAQGLKVVLVVPGPVDEWQLMPSDPNDPASGPSRTAINTKRYGDACRAMGKRMGLPMVDLWTLFVKAAGWDGGAILPGSRECPKNGVLGSLLSDGLHFSLGGYQIMYNELVKTVRKHYPEEMPDQLPSVFPEWDKILGVVR